MTQASGPPTSEPPPAPAGTDQLLEMYPADAPTHPPLRGAGVRPGTRRRRSRASASVDRPGGECRRRLLAARRPATASPPPTGGHGHVLAKGLDSRRR
ncbi:hypothetical protein ACRAWF_23155 [Streptomyces sp. L7]